MRPNILRLQDIDKTHFMLVGGKGANLGELTRIESICVPDGFCITTAVFERMIREKTSPVNGLLDQLSLLKAVDRDKIRSLTREIRRVIAGIAVPRDIREEITRHLSAADKNKAYAIRSSATAEDLPAASFAGQQDTYLNIIGEKAILMHISRCWASLFTERAVVYRLQNGFDHRNVGLAVVVQEMVFPQVAGIMFTADPLTSNREIVSIEAGFGLGEGLVSGMVSPDGYKVRNGNITEKKIGAKKRAIFALENGGTGEQLIPRGQQKRQALQDEQVVHLELAGRKIEAHFGRPQDIEWCLVDGRVCIVQSRPITGLFPVPARRVPAGGPGPEMNDEEKYAYVSVGHQQMMTDPIKPLGLSFFLLTTRAPMHIAGGRLFVDVSRQLASPDDREILLNNMGNHDPLIKDALTTLVERGDFIGWIPGGKKEQGAGKSNEQIRSAGHQGPTENDPEIVSGLIRSSQIAIQALKQNIREKSGPEVFDFILEDIHRLKQRLWVPQNMGSIMAAINASSWINEKMKEWLGEKNAADTISQSVPNNITSEMGLELLDVADVIRPYPKIIDYLQDVKEAHFLHGLLQFEGGKETRDALYGYLDKYGMRCPGEIDITSTRWSENPSALIPMILNNLRNFEPGASQRKFEQGRQEAMEKEQELLDRLEQLPGGKQKAKETQRMIRLLRNFLGYREYPKYGIINCYFIYKQALLKEAGRLVQVGVISEITDIYYLTFEEFREVVRTQKSDAGIIRKRKEEHKNFEKLTPPRVITSDGEVITGRYKRENLPSKALVGLAISSGVIEGRARVVMSLEEADLSEGDILVTSFTDPSWTPLFVSLKGLVTEVGGLMTHGAVIAREYGLPAVIGVEHATRLLRDGQRIRVNGTEGYVEILEGGEQLNSSGV